MAGSRTTIALAIATTVAIAAGGILHLAGAPGAGDAVWAAAVAVMLVPLSVSVVRALARRDVGVDAIALLAMAGALALGEYLAGAVIALMLAGGNALEAYAAGRARRELTALVERAPTDRAPPRRRARSRRCRSSASCPATSSWCAPARSSRSTASWSAARRWSTSRR